MSILTYWNEILAKIMLQEDHISVYKVYIHEFLLYIIVERLTCVSQFSIFHNTIDYYIYGSSDCSNNILVNVSDYCSNGGNGCTLPDFDTVRRG